MSVKELRTPLLLEIATENFIDVVSILSVHGYRVTARAESPHRHRVEDEIPHFQPQPPEGA